MSIALAGSEAVFASAGTQARVDPESGPAAHTEEALENDAGFGDEL